MRLNAYTIYDSASGIYMRPFFAPADGAAIREFDDLAVSADHPIGQHPADYTLYRVGTFNDNKGDLVGEQLEKLRTGPEAVHEARQVPPGQLDAFDETLTEGNTNA